MIAWGIVKNVSSEMLTENGSDISRSRRDRLICSSNSSRNRRLGNWNCRMPPLLVVAETWVKSGEEWWRVEPTLLLVKRPVYRGCLQSSPELLQRFLIPATPTLTLLSGRRRLRTSLLASSRTSLSTQTTRLVRLSLLLVHSSNSTFRIYTKYGIPSLAREAGFLRFYSF